MELALAREAADEISLLASEIAAAPPGLVDDREWVAAARRASCRLPIELRETLRHFRHDSGPDATLLIHGFPVREAELPATPMVAGSAETAASPTAAMLALTMLHLGELVAFRPEKGGALVQNVVPVPDREQDQSNAGSTLLQMHVENAFHPHRPDLVALFCLRGDRDRRAALTVASVRDALPLLSDRTRKVLGTRAFVTEAPPSFGSGASLGAEHAVLDGDPDDPDLQVDFFSTKPADDLAASAMAELADALRSVTRRLDLEPGDLAIVDNRLIVHGRTAFSPYYDGRDRWLQRSFVHLDHRRSRVMRRGGGSVLD
ncbi:TauD/TfdA family dioxygenase [Amycolatopsis sp. NPDC051758]|uniref:TauD/TfdA family dioxygenase n=1 Tax=Amycolatopsis sp. NPDC051758 TaxID=3363935 RepID=UPI0037A59B97